jgi:hypothetical protein
MKNHQRFEMQKSKSVIYTESLIIPVLIDQMNMTNITFVENSKANTDKKLDQNCSIDYMYQIKGSGNNQYGITNRVNFRKCNGWTIRRNQGENYNKEWKTLLTAYKHNGLRPKFSIASTVDEKTNTLISLHIIETDELIKAILDFGENNEKFIKENRHDNPPTKYFYIPFKYMKSLNKKIFEYNNITKCITVIEHYDLFEVCCK